MYNNNFIVVIKKNGNVLREINNNQVFLPFNSEYTILIKNKNSRRAIAEITIDGMDISHGGFIIPANDEIELERFVLDGNLDSGKKFKFVSKDNPNVTDSSNIETGKICVRLWLEQFVFKSTKLTTHNYKSSGTATIPYNCYDENVSYTNLTNLRSTALTNGVLNCCVSTNISNGATIEGGKSDQKFVYSNFDVRDLYSFTTFEFILMGTDMAIKSRDVLYCSHCGKKINYTYNFCSACGNSVKID